MQYVNARFTELQNFPWSFSGESCIPMLPAAHKLLKSVPWLELASVKLRPIPVRTDGATSPTQEQRRTERKENALAVDIRFDGDSFNRCRQCEAQLSSKNHGIEFVRHLGHRPVAHFSLHQESSCIGPVAGRDGDRLAAIGRPFRFDSGECTWAGNARNSYITEFITRTGVEGCRSESRFPPAIR
jgi:hypothetical protein